MQIMPDHIHAIVELRHPVGATLAVARDDRNELAVARNDRNESAVARDDRNVSAVARYARNELAVAVNASFFESVA